MRYFFVSFFVLLGLLLQAQRRSPNIAGQYQFQDRSVSCKLNLKIVKKNNQYLYTFKSKVRTVKGKATVEHEKDMYYINLHQFEWSEYEGAVDGDENTDQDGNDLPLPTIVQGLWSPNKITIQNTGNAMNYYVKIGECDVKYITLKKINQSP